MDQEGLSIIIPAYNEARAIGPVLRQIRATMDETELPYEILVVDDGSQDGTAEIAE